MDEIEVQGRNIEEITERAGQLLNCKPEYLEFTVLKDERKGNNRQLTCKVWKREYKTAGMVGAEEEEDLSPEAETAREILQELVQRVMEDTQVVVRETAEMIQLNISGDNSGLIIGRKGSTLEALQHILVKIISQRGLSLDKVLVIDVEGYRQRRREMLERMARKLKKEAQQYRKPVFVEPMSPFERRIIHMTLSNERDVYTKSVGFGINRQVVIVPNDYPEDKLERMSRSREH